MALWTFVFLCLFYVFMECKNPLQTSLRSGLSAHQKDLTTVIVHFQELQETLLAGLAPNQERWESLFLLPPPWNALSSDSLLMLRKAGGSLIPTLRRLCDLAESQNQALITARTQTSQSMAQAFICGGFVPLLGFGLASLMPALQNHLQTWIFACTGALILTGIGCGWMLQMAEAARWGNLPRSRRSWNLAAQCTGEKILAQIRCGTPPDLAWTRATASLTQSCSELAQLWGHSVWSTSEKTQKTHIGIHETLISGGSSLKQAIQISLMEGRPCVARIETTLLGLRRDVQGHIDSELALLGTRTLKPLFLCVAPALIGLLFYSMLLTLSESPEMSAFFEN